MTLAEKRTLLIKEIQQMPEEALDKLLAAIPSENEAEERENKRSQKVAAIIQHDFKRYHKVFEALS
ncbi:MAG: hypothetical protein ACFCUI_09075 [Bernardetiaceae bacterium]